MLAGDEEELRTQGVVAKRPTTPAAAPAACSPSHKEHTTLGEIREDERLGKPVNPDAHIHLFGQEVNPETFAVCKSDLFMEVERRRRREEHPVRAAPSRTTGTPEPASTT